MNDSSELSAWKTRRRRSDRLLRILDPFPHVVVLMHDNPDPDAIASGWAVMKLVNEKLRKPCRLIGGGAIVRAENRQMVRLLDPPVELVDELHLDRDAAVVLVDCGLQAANHLQLDDADNARPVAVIDHHQTPDELPVAFRDVRPQVAASATITATYLREQALIPEVPLATALLYALHTETQGGQTYYSAADRTILPWLTRFADPELLAQIENAPLSRDYYSDLVLALQRTFIYEDVAFCLLPRAEGAEIVGEVADLLIRGEGIHRVFCGAAVGRDVLVSVRTDRKGGNAAMLVDRALRGLGRGGGHEHRAGGKISNVTNGDRISDELQDELRSAWLDTCGIQRRRGTRLIRRREIVKNL